MKSQKNCYASEISLYQLKKSHNQCPQSFLHELIQHFSYLCKPTQTETISSVSNLNMLTYYDCFLIEIVIPLVFLNLLVSFSMLRNIFRSSNIYCKFPYKMFCNSPSLLKTVKRINFLLQISLVVISIEIVYKIQYSLVHCI